MTIRGKEIQSMLILKEEERVTVAKGSDQLEEDSNAKKEEGKIVVMEGLDEFIEDGNKILQNLDGENDKSFKEKINIKDLKENLEKALVDIEGNDDNKDQINKKEENFTQKTKQKLKKTIVFFIKRLEIQEKKNEKKLQRVRLKQSSETNKNKKDQTMIGYKEKFAKKAEYYERFNKLKELLKFKGTWWDLHNFLSESINYSDKEARKINFLPELKNNQLKFADLEQFLEATYGSPKEYIKFKLKQLRNEYNQFQDKLNLTNEGNSAFDHNKENEEHINANKMQILEWILSGKPQTIEIKAKIIEYNKLRLAHDSKFNEEYKKNTYLKLKKRLLETIPAIADLIPGEYREKSSEVVEALILTSTNNVNKKEGDVDSKQNEVLIKAIQIIENQRESEKETKQIDLYSGLSEKEKIDFENNKKKVVQNLVNHIKGINIIIGLDSEEEFVVNKIITNYQIHLKEKSDQPFAFKFQTTIDRRIYMNLVQRLAFEFFSKKELNNERENEKNNDFDTKFSHENQEQRDKLESKAENFIK